jgi:DNA polymerase delta subunit 3
MDGSAPEHEPLSDHVPTKTVTIVAEDKLKGLETYSERHWWCLDFANKAV